MVRVAIDAPKRAAVVAVIGNGLRHNANRRSRAELSIGEQGCSLMDTGFAPGPVDLSRDL